MTESRAERRQSLRDENADLKHKVREALNEIRRKDEAVMQLQKQVIDLQGELNKLRTERDAERQNAQLLGGSQNEQVRQLAEANRELRELCRSYQVPLPK